MTRWTKCLNWALFGFCVAVGSRCWAVEIETVLIGNPGNAPDIVLGGFGSVSNSFRIGKFELTNSQYAEFLNSVAAVDPYLLFNSEMSTSPHGGITRSGAAGSFSYQPKPGMANKPVNFINWIDSARFANWMHNGQGNGDTENGAYTLLGGLEIPINSPGIYRNAGARWFIPSESEWYKAAFYDPNVGVYYDYPLGTNAPPTAQAPPGSANSANFADAVGTVTDVGAYSNSPSPYGTFDQGGNVSEWNEGGVYFFADRGVRGGSYHVLDDAHSLSNTGGAVNFNNERAVTGLRIGTIVPEPTTTSLASAALLLVSLRRRIRRGHGKPVSA